MQTVSLGEAQPRSTVSCCLKCLEQAAGVVWGAVGSLFAQANRPVAIATLICYCHCPTICVTICKAWNGAEVMP